MPILKLRPDDPDAERKELEFTVRESLKIPVEERYRMMFELSRLVRERLEAQGCREPVEIVKRQ